MQNATIKARTTCCSSPPLLGMSPVGDVASAVENVSAAYSGTTAAPHEYFDHTGDDTTRRRDGIRAAGCGPGLEGHRQEPASGSREFSRWAGNGKTQVTRQDRASCGLV